MTEEEKERNKEMGRSLSQGYRDDVMATLPNDIESGGQWIDGKWVTHIEKRFLDKNYC